MTRRGRRVHPVSQQNPAVSQPISAVRLPIKVDIWSDIQCPWCYIGKRKFEAAVAATGADVEVEYHSFELAPDTPVDFAGTPLDYLSERKGIAPPRPRR